MKHNRIHYYRVFLGIALAVALGAGIWYCWHSYRMHMAPKDGVLVEEGMHMTPKDGVLAEEDMHMSPKDGVLAEEGMHMAPKDDMFVEEDVINDFREEKTGRV